MILSIETATRVCSVAIHKEGELLGMLESEHENSHSSELTVLVERLMKQLHLSPSDFSAVAVSEGPGSYTGLRIGLSVAKGFCYALEIPLILVRTLHGIAMNALSESKNLFTEHSLILPMIDARRMEVYSAVYNQNLELLEEVKAEIIQENSYQSWLNSGFVLYLAGDGAQKCRSLLGHLENVRFVNNVRCSADGIGKLAWGKYQRNEFADLAYSEPFYLKEFTAASPKVKGLYE
ncbi:MAG: tRNA (adenosine(37)-N6)-threonylcarbamoyltransferase complex dimerization subunit type 1 TsaB [Bacteroidales bacterium]|nr:tRNA (adenosine(37)-N6)-threonylcarbamoyltransferase complex dimerization subunit type 1 TsaB [Bacteroidales bacterium]